MIAHCQSGPGTTTPGAIQDSWCGADRAKSAVSERRSGGVFLGPNEGGPPLGTGDTKGEPLKCTLLAGSYEPDERRP
jgi:hypothetical protein